MAVKTHRIYLEVADLQILTGRSMSQCYRIYQTFRDMSGRRKITIRKYCQLEGIEDVSEVYDALGIKVE